MATCRLCSWPSQSASSSHRITARMPDLTVLTDKVSHMAVISFFPMRLLFAAGSAMLCLAMRAR